MYTQCVTCTKIGVMCKGPYFMDMTTGDIFDWIKARKAYLGWSNATLAERTGVPIGTINRLLGNTAAADFRFESIRPILRALTGTGDGSELPCPDPDSSEVELLRGRVRHLEDELSETRTMAARNDQRDANTIAHLTKQTHNLRLTAIIFAGVLVLVLLAIIGVLVYDITHPDIGYFTQMFMN